MIISDLRRLRALVPGVTLIKAVHVTGEDALGCALGYADAADALVLDSRSADRLGGTGLTHDRSVSRRIVAAVSPVAVYLAAGRAYAAYGGVCIVASILCSGRSRDGSRTAGT
jgi:phosphoribosylanthranilate isomerase